MPPELMLLPPSVPLNIFDFACWARQTVAALTVVSAYKPIRPRPFRLDELRTGALRSRSSRCRRGRARSSASTGCCTGTSGVPRRRFAGSR